MKKIFPLLFFIMMALTAFSQAKKPTIMVVPSENWCKANNFGQTIENQGKTVFVPDYKAALQNNSDLILAISKINEMMAERGFPLKNLESALNTIENQAAEDAMLTNKSGEDVAESPIDKLKKTAKADIWMQLTWAVKHTGPKNTVDFVLQGIDAYTDKQIAGASGTSAPSFTTDVAILLQEAVLMHIDGFNSQLQAHFDDLFANGREITVRIKVWNDFADGDGLETEYDDKELGEIIENWMSENTVNGRFSTTDATENMMLFEQVRIPMTVTSDGKEKSVDARSWVGNLRKYLRKTYDIESKLMMQGLGQAQLVIGGK